MHLVESIDLLKKLIKVEEDSKASHSTNGFQTIQDNNDSQCVPSVGHSSDGHCKQCR